MSGSSTVITMRRLLYGQLLGTALRAAVEFGIPDLLARGRRPITELAALAGVRPDLLRRLLRALAVFGVFTEHGEDRFGLTPLGETLRRDAPGSAAPTALLAGGEIGQAWGHLASTVRTGTPAFETLFGTGFFAHLQREPELRAVFDRSQQAGLELELDTIVGAVLATGGKTVVDVGGGDGALLAALLTAVPELTGVLLERDEAVRAAEVRLSAAGVAGRCELRTGDFFAEFTGPPSGGDVYLLRHVLHDWPDDRCVALLRACAAAMRPDAELLVIETVADPAATGLDAEVAALMDLYMMTLFQGGRERTRAELEALLDSGGLAVTGVTELPGGAAIIGASRQ